MTDLQPYLDSPAAADDARTLLCLDRVEGECRWFRASEAVFWAVDSAQQWTRVVLTSPSRVSHVIYFRQDGDRFVLSDLGEAVAALRKRTGFWHDHSLLSRQVVWPTALDAQIETSSSLAAIGSDGNIRVVVMRSDLPAALCRCLLAVELVGRLVLRELAK